MRIASRAPIAQRCSTSAIAAAESVGTASSTDQYSSSTAKAAALGGLGARFPRPISAPQNGPGALVVVDREVGMVQSPDDAVGVLVNDEQVDDANDVALA